MNVLSSQVNKISKSHLLILTSTIRFYGYQLSVNICCEFQLVNLSTIFKYQYIKIPFILNISSLHIYYVMTFILTIRFIFLLIFIVIYTTLITFIIFFNINDIVFQLLFSLRICTRKRKILLLI